MKKLLFAILIILVCCSCGSTKVMTQTVRDASVDTVYLSNVQYDSIYIYKDKLTDRSRDTIHIKDVCVEYRYKLLRDTVKLVERDSIPYEVTITEVKKITRPLNWFDHLSRYSFFFFLGFILYWICHRLKLLKLF